MAMTILILFPPHWPITTNAKMRWGTSAAKLVDWRPGYGSDNEADDDDGHGNDEEDDGDDGDFDGNVVCRLPL